LKGLPSHAREGNTGVLAGSPISQVRGRDATKIPKLRNEAKLSSKNKDFPEIDCYKSNPNTPIQHSLMFRNQSTFARVRIVLQALHSAFVNLQKQSH
jgi:hypothetical protein